MRIQETVATGFFALLALAPPVQAADGAASGPPSAPEKIDLFEARTGGYWTCRIPVITVTRTGAVLVTSEARPGKGHVHERLLRRLLDEPFLNLERS